MVSLWPFGGQDNSPGAFEKKLSTFAAQILDYEKRLNRLRTRGRRFKALWTIYTIIAWVIYATILTLVVGLDHANVYQFAGLGLSPFVVYLVRQIIKRYYEWRVHGVETSLEALREQQTETIEKLKAVTKYDSTQALLDKYTKSSATGAQPHGQVPPGSVGPGSQAGTPPGTLRKRNPQGQKPQPGSRAGSLEPQFIHEPSPAPSTPQLQPLDAFPPGMPPGVPPQVYAGMPPGMGLSPVGQFAPPPPEEPREPQWYDRFLDVLLGEDEMSAKNRYALICSNCRQVNGLAPPGTNNVEDIRFICGRCGAENGKPAVKELIGKIAEDQAGGGSSQSKSKKSKPKSNVSGEDRVVYAEADDDYEGVAAVTDGEFRGNEESGSGIEEAVVVKKKKGRPSKRKG
ncbi:hypothetical protein H072_3245 [Dactylellina haptotyla CBS 200.50]|uniref:Endoplasmic reticulum junction formation protein lunapark n=1 Tax=Dactylellina haptotyla (strain CBS 200.50) TaxID=1284197 RepID=S8AIQ4_DACHA|nr:hypothetical protein H072_3245 [Dactylellina haptotyla CBS 200.50]